VVRGLFVDAAGEYGADARSIDDQCRAAGQNGCRAVYAASIIGGRYEERFRRANTEWVEYEFASLL
jgi:hypothetical protein